MSDGSPLIYLSGETDRMGHVSNINLSACRVFGYLHREEILHQNVKMLMPNIYARFHDEIVRTACMKSNEQFSNKERNVFGRHSSGFVFPASLQIRYFQSFLHGKQFVATLKTEKKPISQSIAYLIVDPQGRILETSSSKDYDLEFRRFQHPWDRQEHVDEEEKGYLQPWGPNRKHNESRHEEQVSK